MKLTIRKGWLLGGAAAIVYFVLVYAWADGGREPLRAISEPVPVPGAAK